MGGDTPMVPKRKSKNMDAHLLVTPVTFEPFLACP